MDDHKKVPEHALRTECLLVAALTLFAFSLRYYNWNFNSYWSDELFSAYYSNPSKSFEELIASLQKETNPYLYPIVLWAGYKIFGYAEWVGRGISIFFGTLLIPALYITTKKIYNSRTAVYTAAFASLSYLFIQCSVDTRSYSLFLLMSALSTYFFFCIYEKRSIPLALMYVLCTSAMINTHFYGFLVAAAQFLCIAFAITKNISRFKYYFFTYTALLLCNIYFILKIFLLSSGTKDFWIPVPDLAYVAAVLVDLFHNGVVAAFFYGLAIYGLYRQKTPTFRHLAVTSCLMLLVFPAIISQFMSYGVLFYRYIAPLLIIVLMAAAASLDSIRKPLVSYILTICSCVILACALFTTKFYTEKHKEDYRGALLEIAQQRTTEPVFGLYFLKPLTQWHGLDFVIKDAKDIADLPTGTRFWLINPESIAKPDGTFIKARVLQEISTHRVWAVLYEKE